MELLISNCVSCKILSGYTISTVAPILTAMWFVDIQIPLDLPVCINCECGSFNRFNCQISSLSPSNLIP